MFVRRHVDEKVPRSSDYRFLRIDEYRLQVGLNEADEAVALSTLLEDPTYDQDFIGPRSTARSRSGVHGPYRLDRLSNAVFEPVSLDDVLTLCDVWLTAGNAAGETLTPDVSSWMRQRVSTAAEGAVRLYHVPQLAPEYRDLGLWEITWPPLWFVFLGRATQAENAPYTRALDVLAHGG